MLASGIGPRLTLGCHDPLLVDHQPVEFTPSIPCGQWQTGSFAGPCPGECAEPDGSASVEPGFDYSEDGALDTSDDEDLQPAVGGVGGLRRVTLTGDQRPDAVKMASALIPPATPISRPSGCTAASAWSSLGSAEDASQHHKHYGAHPYRDRRCGQRSLLSRGRQRSDASGHSGRKFP